MSSSGAFDASTPAFAQTKPCRVTVISTPWPPAGPRATRRARPGRGAASLSELARPAATRAGRARPTTACASGPPPWRRPCARSRAHRRRVGEPAGIASASSAARSSPGPISGQPLERDRGASGHPQPPMRISCRSIPRVCAAPPWRTASVASSTARSSGVSTSSASEPTATVCASSRAAARRPLVALDGCRGRTTARSRRAGTSSSALVPGSVPVGHDHAPNAAGGGWRSARPVRRGRAAGSRPGPAGHARRRARARGATPRRGRVVVAVLVVLDHHRAVAVGDPLRAVVAGDDERSASISVQRRSATSTSENIASASTRRVDGSSASPGAAWHDRSS